MICWIWFLQLQVGKIYGAKTVPLVCVLWYWCWYRKQMWLRRLQIFSARIIITSNRFFGIIKKRTFFDVLNQGCMIKTPSRFVIADEMREFDVKMPALTDWDTNYGHWNTLYSHMTNQGTEPARPSQCCRFACLPGTTVSWKWITTDSLPKRNQFTDIMTSTGYSRNGFRMQFDFVTWAKHCPTRKPGWFGGWCIKIFVPHQIYRRR